MIKSGLFTDLYSLTMMQGYFFKKRHAMVTFDMFIRAGNNQFGYMIFTGLEVIIRQLLEMRFSDDDIAYLSSLGMFREEFLEYLRSYKFNGSVWAMHEGSLCFPQEPVIKVKTNIMEAQLIEGMMLNTINFQTLIATKTARICHVAKHRPVIELGLRRAQGPDGAVSASRASFVGGAYGTSNLMAGKMLDIPVLGTMAHSWVMSYENEERAFRDFAEIYPQGVSFLLDTHDTLRSGIKNAIKVGKELQRQGINFSVRLDSGDIEYLSQQVRYMLNQENLNEVKIIASNDLDEYVVSQIISNNAPVDIIGIGTQLVTGGKISSLPGVYKISEIQSEGGEGMRPLIKTSNDIAKSSLPSDKQVYRFSDGQYIADLVALTSEVLDEHEEIVFHHPFSPHKSIVRESSCSIIPMLHSYILEGELCNPLPSIKEIQTYAKKELQMLDGTYLRLINPHEYHVSISTELKQLRDSILFQKK